MNRRDVLRAAAVGAAGFVLSLADAHAEGDAAAAPRLGVRRGRDRGHVDHGWLDARHTFSFASYRDPKWMGFRSLRVINEDRIAAGKGFAMHPHQDMEIITYILSGSLEHKDSMGNGSVIVPGEIQQMSAGRGIRHSEFNPSAREPVHLLQIWIEPDRRGVTPRYGQRAFPVARRTNTLALVASKDGRDGSIPIHQDANLRAGVLEEGKRIAWRNPRGRHVWLQVARGRLDVGGREVSAGDAVWTSDPGDLALSPKERSEVLLFDLG